MATALITGASAGLGAEYAKLFAHDKHDLLLVARRRDRLEALAAELARAHPIRVYVLDANLSSAAGVEKVLAEVERLTLDIEFLVNNAGFGSTSAFAEADPTRELEMVQLNVATPVALTRALLPSMIARKRGRVLNIGSIAGFQPGPFMATYYASKAFVNCFTEALAFELRGTGVTATVSCPGAIATEFPKVAGIENSRLFQMGAAPASEIARQGYAAMLAGKAMVIHGLKNKLAVQALRVSPRAAVTRIASKLNR